MLLLLLVSSSAILGTCHADQTTITMPKIVPSADSYLCTSVPIDSEGEIYITGFKANAEKHNAHHILVFGCEEPGSDREIWDCGEMTSHADNLERAPTCASKPAIIYAWAKDAPELKLPKDVAFKVGGESGINHIVMQVHYMHESKEEDESGVTLTYTDVVQPRSAATMLLVTGGVLPHNAKETFETACVIDENVELHPFAYRVHTHRHGKDVSGWLVREDGTGEDKWSLIGRRDPQLPQMFMPVANSSLTITQGDMLSARCVMENNENRDITMGPSGEDEMCNFYIMYWTEGETLPDNTCFSPGAPYYYWHSEAALNHIPK